MIYEEKCGDVKVQDKGTAYPTVAGLVWQRRRFLLRFVLVCSMLTAIAVFLLPNSYESTVSLMPPSSSPGSAMTGMLMGSTSSDISSLAGGAIALRSKSALNSAILRSSSVQDAIINRFDLRKEYRVPYMKDARKALSSHTMLNEDTKSGVISITVTDHDRYRAAEIAGAYVQELNRVSVQNNNTSAHLQRIFVEKRLGEVNQDLKVSSAKLAQFSSKNMTIDTATQGKAMMEAGSDLEGKLISTEAQLSGLRKYYTDDNPRVSSLLATVSELQKQLNRMRTGKETGGTSGEIYPSLRELPLLSETYEDLFRHVRIEATVADLLTRQFEAAKVEEAKELPVVQMLDSPNVAEKHSSPKRGLVIVGSFFFYISLGVLLIFLEGYWKGLDSSDKKKMLFAELAGYGRSLLHG